MAVAVFLWATGGVCTEAAEDTHILVGDPANRAIYLLLDGQKQLVPDVATLEALGYSLDDVRWTDAASLAAIPSKPNLLPLTIGDLIRDEEEGTLYLLAGGKRAITGEATLRACGWAVESARVIPAALVAVLPDGQPLPDLEPGDLVRREPNGCLYVLAEGKHWLPDDVAPACGWQEEDAHTPDPLLWKRIPEGDMLPTLYFGQLLGSIDDGDERIYLLDGGKHLIPDEATFQAYGWKRSAILRLPPAILEVIPTGAPLAAVKKGENVFTYDNWGQCTWYVAERRIVPSHRSAKYWYEDARRNGFAVGQRPMQGAVIVYSSGSDGHVAYVEAAYADGSFVRADSNICGWECVRRRITDLRHEAGVLGFVYWKYAATE